MVFWAALNIESGLLDSIPAPLEDDSDSDFKSGPYIPTPAKPKKRTRKSSSSTLPQKRRKATKNIESDEEEEFIPNVHERKKELLVIFEDDEEDEQELDEESSDHSKYSDESKTSDPIGFLNLSARSLKKELERDNRTDSVTESESCAEGSSIQTSQANQSARISAPVHKQTTTEGYEPDSVTESESDAEAASQVPPKATKASHYLSAVARGKRPQASTQESDSVTESESESESEPQPISKPKALSRRPGFVLQPGQQLASYYLDEQKTAKIPSTLNPFLREYQREGVQFLYRQYAAGKGGLLGDDMGLSSFLMFIFQGKTIQTISFLSAIMKKTGFSTDKHRRKQYVSRLQDNKDWRKHMPKADKKWPTCIIIAPSSVTGNWEQEFRKWGYFEVGLYMGPKRADVLKDFKLGRLDVLVTSFEIASRDIEELYDLAFTCIIIDEAHRLKDKNTQLSTSCSRFLTPLRYGLTGTAIQNNYNEFWALLDWTNPGEVGTLKQWKHYVTTPLVKAQSATATEDEQVIGSAVAAVLRDKLLPEFFLRRTKDIIKDQVCASSSDESLCMYSLMLVSLAADEDRPGGVLSSDANASQSIQKHFVDSSSAKPNQAR
uniref:Helicase ATP-binding domain-containing protein n=1 Tax=Psilocybe cubensis TaxID=181762 RepID=A0A8H7XTQ6_PSICU